MFNIFWSDFAVILAKFKGIFITNWASFAFIISNNQIFKDWSLSIYFQANYYTFESIYDLLQPKPMIKCIIFSDNQIGENGCKHLSDSLKEMKSITQLNLNF